MQEKPEKTEATEQMLTRLLALIASQQQRHRDILASVPGVVWETRSQTDAPGQHADFVSEYVETMLGYTVEEWLSTPEFWLTIVHPDDREQAARNAAEAFIAGGRSFNTFRWITKDGRILWVESQAVVVNDEAGRPVAMRGVTMDVTERREAIEALRRRTGELEQSQAALERTNRELDQFAYITSHDLKAPLRGIANLASWIEEDLGDDLTDETRKQLKLLRGRVDRMSAMIEGILQYSRIGRVTIQTETVDVGALLAEAVDLLDPPEGFAIVIAPNMPTLETERLRLQQVFMNLIGNAVKHHDRPEGTITIGVKETGAFYEFSVADDGPGIAPAYHNKVFEIFQTLEARDKVENTGVGLSLVKKIVEGQGGTIRLTSELGSGATFTFTWPKTSPRNRPAG